MTPAHQGKHVETEKPIGRTKKMNRGKPMTPNPHSPPSPRTDVPGEVRAAR